MNLVDLDRQIKEKALSLGCEKYAEGNVYEILNSGRQIYPQCVLTIESISNTSDDLKSVRCVLFYIDRLRDNVDNKLYVQSEGIRVLDSIIDDYSVDSVVYTPFTEKFADMCGGVYCTLNITIEKEMC